MAIGNIANDSRTSVPLVNPGAAGETGTVHEDALTRWQQASADSHSHNNRNRDFSIFRQ